MYILMIIDKIYVYTYKNIIYVIKVYYINKK